MQFRSHLLRVPVFTLILVLFAGSTWAEDKRPSRYTPRTASEQSGSGQSSRWGDRLNQMKSQSSRSSSSSTYNRPSSRSSSGSGSVNRTRSSSTPTTRPSSNFNSGRTTVTRPSSSINRSQVIPGRSSSVNRSRVPTSTSRPTLTRPGSTNYRNQGTSSVSRPSSSNGLNRIIPGASRPSTSSSVNRGRTSPSDTRNRGTSSVSRPSSSNGLNRIIPGTSRPSSGTSINRGRPGSSSTIDRNRGTTTTSRPSITRPGLNTGRDRGTTQVTRPSTSNSLSRVIPGMSRSGSSTTINRGRPGLSGTIDRNRGTTGNSRPGINRPGINEDRNRGGRPDGSSRPDYDDDHNRGTGKDRDRDRDHDRDYDRDRDRDYDRDHRRGNYGGSYRSDYNRYRDRHYGPSRHDYYYRLYNDPFYYSRYYGYGGYPYRSHTNIYLNATPQVYGHYTSGRAYGKTSPGYAVFYEHAGFRGNSLEVHAGEGIVNLADLKKGIYTSFNDRISSVKIYGNVTVVMYEASNFRGDYMYVHGSVYDFDKDMYLRPYNDEISSIEVLAGNVDEQSRIAYVEEDPYKSYGNDGQVTHELQPVDAPGYTAPTAPAPTTPAAAPIDQRPAVSMPTSPSTDARVHFYDQPDFKGNQIVLVPGTFEAKLSDRGKGLASNWNDAIASIRVEGGAEVFLYTDPEFLGEGIAIRESVPNIAADGSLVTFTGTISSVLVSPASGAQN